MRGRELKGVEASCDSRLRQPARLRTILVSAAVLPCDNASIRGDSLPVHDRTRRCDDFQRLIDQNSRPRRIGLIRLPRGGARQVISREGACLCSWLLDRCAVLSPSLPPSRPGPAGRLSVPSTGLYTTRLQAYLHCSGGSRCPLP